MTTKATSTLGFGLAVGTFVGITVLFPLIGIMSLGQASITGGIAACLVFLIQQRRAKSDTSAGSEREGT